MGSESDTSRFSSGGPYVQSLHELESIYGSPVPASLSKELGYISDHYRQMIEKSPFAIIATVGEGGLDCSPRGVTWSSFLVHKVKRFLQSICSSFKLVWTPVPQIRM